MPNQRAIARASGLCQATVSLALRGSPNIPEATRRKVLSVAEKLGYRPNAYVSALMAHIRSGRPINDKGCIALIVDTSSLTQWFNHETFRKQYEGMVKRAAEIGFQTECFFLQAPGMNIKRLERILHARGISGVVLTAPRHLDDTHRQFDLSRFACATIAYSWEAKIDRVSSNHRHNVDLAYESLLARGYRRIGMCLPPRGAHGVDYSWKDRFLLWNERTPVRQRIPLFVGQTEQTPIGPFRRWLTRWKPEALVTLVGDERLWLDQLKYRIPEDIGLVCLNLPSTSSDAGVEENHEIIGAATIELTAAQIQRNELGPPTHPKLILIEGTWRDGSSIRTR